MHCIHWQLLWLVTLACRFRNLPLFKLSTYFLLKPFQLTSYFIIYIENIRIPALCKELSVIFFIPKCLVVHIHCCFRFSFSSSVESTSKSFNFIYLFVTHVSRLPFAWLVEIIFNTIFNVVFLFTLFGISVLCFTFCIDILCLSLFFYGRYFVFYSNICLFDRFL